MKTRADLQSKKNIGSSLVKKLDLIGSKTAPNIKLESSSDLFMFLNIDKQTIPKKMQQSESPIIDQI
jgi:hypothetical protein